MVRLETGWENKLKRISRTGMIQIVSLEVTKWGLVITRQKISIIFNKYP